jgi:MoxR-like ATPase
MRKERGDETLFSSDEIWEYASDKIPSGRRPGVITWLVKEGLIQRTGKMRHAVTEARASSMTPEYRFTPRGAPRTLGFTGLCDAFSADCESNLVVESSLLLRVVSALLSKRFLILTGLAGSGKTKLAQALARWITPVGIASDPFRPGAKLEAARKVYSITNADSLGVECTNEEGTKVLLPRAIIEQWANYIEEHKVPESIGAQDLRDRIKKQGGEYSDYLQNFETHYKPAAFALLKAKKTASISKCYEVIPVGADWTGTENILGYPNGLDEKNYVTKPAFELIRRASNNKDVPYFLILDEMNLSHVERYFADLLSAIESGEEIPLYEGIERQTDGKPVSRRLLLPDNLFIIGTVNVDETTYMFSPKVLDRANVIELRMEPDEFASFLEDAKAPKLEELDSKGAVFGKEFVMASADKTRALPGSVETEYQKEMLLFFNLLREHNSEFGYRVGYEAVRFIHFYKELGGYPDDTVEWFNGAMDCVIVQKLLPKLHGSRSKLEGLLWALAWACGAERIDRDGKNFVAQLREASQAQEESKYSPETVWSTLRAKHAENPAAAARYPLSFEKVMRMWRRIVRDQFVSFAEA